MSKGKRGCVSVKRVKKMKSFQPHFKILGAARTFYHSNRASVVGREGVEVGRV